jgi:glutamate synthase domain-containing protein 2
MLRGWVEELRLILSAVGLSSVKDLVGRRDLLVARDVMKDEARLLGVNTL